MIFQMNFFKALFYPDTVFFQLSKAERMEGWRIRLIELCIVSLLVFSCSGYFGLSTHGISPELAKSSSMQYEALKSFFIGGRIVLSLLYVAIMLLLPAVYFWTFSNEMFIKFVIVQAFTLPILFVEQVSYIIFVVGFDLPWYSSIFSLGVVTQAITANTYVIYFFSCMSLFKWWVLRIQYRGVRALTEKSKMASFLIVLSINLIFWSITAALAFIDFTKIL